MSFPYGRKSWKAVGHSGWETQPRRNQGSVNATTGIQLFIAHVPARLIRPSKMQFDSDSFEETCRRFCHRYTLSCHNQRKKWISKRCQLDIWNWDWQVFQGREKSHAPIDWHEPSQKFQFVKWVASRHWTSQTILLYSPTLLQLSVVW